MAGIKGAMIKKMKSKILIVKEGPGMPAKEAGPAAFSTGPTHCKAVLCARGNEHKAHPPLRILRLIFVVKQIQATVLRSTAIDENGRRLLNMEQFGRVTL